MLDAINLPKLTENEEIKLLDYKDCLKQMVCSSPKDECYLDQYNLCPTAETLCDILRNLLVKSSIERVEYAVWTVTDRSTLYTI